MNWSRQFVVSLAAVLAFSLVADSSPAAILSWNFDNGDLSAAAQFDGTGTLSFKDTDTQNVTMFGNTATSAVPDMPDGPANYLYHPVLPGGGDGGYQLSYTNVPGNGGGTYVNEYTMIFDVYIPTLNWTALFNSNPGNANDADFYVDPQGLLGIGALGYTASPVISANTWHRIGLVFDYDDDFVRYYVDGNKVFDAPNAGGVDGRFSLFRSEDTAPHLNLHGEGDGSGNYTNELYWGSFAIADFALDDATMQALGGASAMGVFVPEPSTFGMASLAGWLVLAMRRRRGLAHVA